jgi:hypothetical protein
MKTKESKTARYNRMIAVRKTTYQQPRPIRCELCVHYWPYGHTCQIEFRGKIEPFKVHPSGYCDLFERGSRK